MLMLKEGLPAKFGVDTAENGPSKVWVTHLPAAPFPRLGQRDGSVDRADRLCEGQQRAQQAAALHGLEERPLAAVVPVGSAA